MREHYTETLKIFFSQKVSKYRNKLGVTQEEMADRLMMSCRSYSDLDNGIPCCSGLTLALFLTTICPDPAAFLEELKEAFDSCKVNTI